MANNEDPCAPGRPRVVLLAVGSGGDIAPLARVGAELARRGVPATLLAPRRYAGLAERAGIAFETIGADDVFDAVFDGPEVWDPRRGLAASWRYYGAALRSGLAWIEARCSPRDTVLVSSSFAVAARVAQERRGFLNTTVHLSPAVMFSYERPPAWPQGSLPARWPAPVKRTLAGLAERCFIDPVIAAQVDPVRAVLSLPRQRRLFSRWIHSPHRVAWMFPEWFAPAASDWPERGFFAGFPLQPASGGALPERVRAFLAAGGGPLAVITPGTAVAQLPSWVRSTADALCAHGARVIVVAPAGADDACEAAGVLATAFVPFDLLLPHADLLVHHGGIGTAVQALRCGVPQWIVPAAHDQPDNARRLEALGAAVVLRPDPCARELAAAWSRTFASGGPAAGIAVLRQRLADEGDGAARLARVVLQDLEGLLSGRAAARKPGSPCAA